ncbi:phosphatidate cytidylyltransferase [Fodinicurvata halophila]|uniref:phosphatidate cytidylyltransferase n=1 Tax=Fodinicurvata halophila TaxID=1419723 RepID=UPI00361B63C1
MSGGTVRLFPQGKVPGNLSRRILAALVLIPLVLGALFLGRPYSDLFLLLVVMLMAWEWVHLCHPATHSRLVPAAFTVFAGLSFMTWSSTTPLLAAAFMASGMAGLLAFGWLSRHGKARHEGYWLALGVLYCVLPIVAFQGLYMKPAYGGTLAIWLLLVVWSTDTAAMAAGRTIGGPRLCPRISPNKTWAGLLGGAIFAGLVGLTAGMIFSYAVPMALAVTAAVLAFVAQAGDLVESLVKRHFDVKDSGRLLPGHGGILDRVDGLVTASPCLLVLLEWPLFESWVTG